MAGDWIKMRVDLVDEPEVIGIADALDMEEDHVVGKLHRLWSWFDQKTVDGNATSVTKKWIDRYLKRDGFADALIEVGWLEVTEVNGKPTVTMPGFERHSGQSGKRRAVTAKRVANHKSKSNAGGNAKGNAASVSTALPREEKRREEKKVYTHTVEIGESLKYPEFESAWERWCDSWETRTGQRFNDSIATSQLMELSRREASQSGKAAADLEFSLQKLAKGLCDSSNDFQRRNDQAKPKATLADVLRAEKEAKSQ